MNRIEEIRKEALNITNSLNKEWRGIYSFYFNSLQMTILCQFADRYNQLQEIVIDFYDDAIIFEFPKYSYSNMIDFEEMDKDFDYCLWINNCIKKARLKAWTLKGLLDGFSEWLRFQFFKGKR